MPEPLPPMAIPERDYLEAFRTAGQHLQACMDASDATYTWIKQRPSKPAFADLIFATGQHMYAVLLAAMSSQKKAENGTGVSASFEIPKREHDLLLEECENNHLEPVIFPLWLGIMQPLTTGWNLYSLTDMRPVTPGEEPDMPPVPMSEWELLNFSVDQVVKELGEQKLQVLSCQDIPAIYPNLWFQDAEGNRAWVAVLPAFGTKHADIRIPAEVQTTHRRLQKSCAGYIARIAVTSAEHPGAHPHRGELLTLSFGGLEKLP